MFLSFFYPNKKETGMVADNNVQVWLVAEQNAGQVIMIPYVKTPREMQVNYQLTLVQNNRAGSSRINQSGNVKTGAAIPISLSHLTVVPKRQSECWVGVTLRENGYVLGNYRFECPD